MLQSCTPMIISFAGKLAREYPFLDFDEVQSEAWLCAVQTREAWDQKGGAKFSTFLYQRLQWLKLQLVDKRVKQLEAERGYAVHEEPAEEMSPGLDTLCTKVLQSLNEEEIEVLRLMVNPPPEFLKFVRRSWKDRRYSRTRRTSLVQNVHYARWLQTYPMRITRIIQRIEEVIAEVTADG